jgi:DNA polymerase III subunit delta
MLSYQALIKKLSEGVFAPVYLLYGEEKYLQEELVVHLTHAFLGPDTDFGKEKLEGSAFSLEETIARLDESGLFSRRRLLIVDNPPYLAPPRKNKEDNLAAEPDDQDLSGKNSPELLESFIDRQEPALPENILVFTAPQVDRRKRLYKLIDRKGVSVECNPLKGEALAAWIRNKAARLDKKIDNMALERLQWAGEQNLHYLSGELEKYSAYLGEDQKVITIQVVDHLFSGDIQGDVFKLADAMAEGNLSRAHELLELLLRRREKPLQIFFMLVRHYRLLLQAYCLLEEGMPPAEFTAALAVHPFVARKMREQAAKCNRLILEEVIIALQKTDFQIKTGRIEPAQALKLVLSKIDFFQSAIRSGAS